MLVNLEISPTLERQLVKQAISDGDGNQTA